MTKEFIQKTVEDAVWEEVAMEFIEKLDYDFQKMFRRNKAELETLGRFIVSERSRKYFEGVQAGGLPSGPAEPEEDPMLNAFLGGFTLCGSKTAEGGTIYGSLGSEILDEWPEEVTLAGHTYTLESSSWNPETSHAEAEYC